MNRKTTTVRLKAPQLSALAAMAMAEGGSVAEQIRQAVDERIERRRNDPEFRARIRASLERNLQAFQEDGRQ